MNDYIDPKDATRIRIHPDGTGSWMIDAANDDDEYTEACWDSRIVSRNDDGTTNWESIPSIEAARELLDKFAEENVPHLLGTEPEIITVAKLEESE